MTWKVESNVSRCSEMRPSFLSGVVNDEECVRPAVSSSSASLISWSNGGRASEPEPEVMNIR